MYRPGLIPASEEGGGKLWPIVEAEVLLQVSPGRDQVATIECDNPHGQVALQQEDRVVLAFCHVEELLAQRFGGGQSRLGAMKSTQAAKHLEVLWRFLHLLAQRVRSAE